jgi:hypothetical protein
VLASLVAATAPLPDLTVPLWEQPANATPRIAAALAVIMISRFIATLLFFNADCSSSLVATR